MEKRPFYWAATAGLGKTQYTMVETHDSLEN